MKKLILSTGIMFAVLLTAGNFAHAQEHKKISSQGQGAIIGGAGGAVVGGLVSHNVKGALIGGAIGAGGGYIIGNEHRRHAIKKRQEAAAERRSGALAERRREQAAYARTHPVHYTSASHM
jgi:uncharacterized protein YcfJ